MILGPGHSLKPMTLSQASPGESYYVESVSGPEQQRLRLSEMGVISGASVSVVTSANRGMLVVKVGGSRLALSQSMTEHVWVHTSAMR